MKVKKSIFKFDNVSLSYDEDKPIFTGIDMEITQGGFYVITGPSGAGKTSLLRMMCLDILPCSGDMFIFGKKYQDFTHDNVVQARQHMGFVYQDFKLLPHMTAYQNIALALHIRMESYKSIDAKVRQILAWVGMSDYADYYPPSLSGGQQQLLALARAVITRPRIIVADEPTGSLDTGSAHRITQLFKALHQQGTTIVIVTHDEQMLEGTPYTRMHIHDNIIQVYHR